jgi:hypothetical protein
MKTTIEKCFELTGAFEGGGYAALAGNFDGAGISFGVIQYNLYSKTLQPVIRDMYAAGPQTFRRCMTHVVQGKAIDLTDELLRVCAMAPAAAVQWAQARQDTGGRFLPHYDHWVRAFKALATVDGFNVVQRKHASRYMERAQGYVKSYGFKSERALALMFDISVQCGSITLGSWTRYQAATVGRVLTEQKKLEALARAVQFQDSRAWVQRDILSRKLTIATGVGIVHGRSYNLHRDFGITDARIA